jgi:signal transduction histidine kinase/streptogramin lyase
VTSVGDGIAWVSRPGDLRPGLIPQSDKAIRMYTHKDGLTDDVVLSIHQDREGNVWVGTPKGLERFRKGNLIPVIFPEGYQRFAIVAGDGGTVWTGSQSRAVAQVQGDSVIPNRIARYVGTTYRDPTGEIWLGGVREVFRIEGETIARFQVPLPADRSAIVEAMSKDHVGRLWISTGGHGIWTLERDHWQPYHNPELPDSGVTAEYTDAQGKVWFGYATDLVAVLDNGEVHKFFPHDGVEVGGIKVIGGRNGDLWVAGESGAAFMKEGRFHLLNAAGANSFSRVSGLIETEDGSVWLGEARGIVRIPSTEVQAAYRDPAHKVQYQLFDFEDGLPGAIQQVATPTAIEGTDRRLWFATVGGLAWIEPADIRQNPLAPPVYVTYVTANGKEYAQPANLTFSARTKNLQIAYTAVSLAIPERIQFRYKLDGVDQGWQDAGNRRIAFYTNLGPGLHRFHVIACNNDGLWNEAGASVDFTILPAFYQTKWFLALCIAASMVVLYMLYLLRGRQVAQQVRGRMQERLDEREQIARDLHDTLLQSVQGLMLKFQAIATRIPEQDSNRHDMEQALEVADEVLQEGRDRVRGLRYDAVVARNLPTAFRRIPEEVAPDSAVTLKTINQGVTRELHPMVLEESYLIGREAVVNALHHSGADQIEVEITYDARHFGLRIRDNGRGIEPEILQQGSRAGHWGLPGMRERAHKIGGHLGVWSGPAGTEIELTVPAATAYQKRDAHAQEAHGG